MVNETRQRLPRVQWIRIFNAVQRALKAWPKTSVALIFTTSVKIKKLNSAYRKKIITTDVLSFPTDKLNAKDGSGDILICPEYVKKKFPSSEFKKILIHRFIHGLLHLHGYGHKSAKAAAKMEEKSQEIINKISYGGHHAR